MRKGTLSEKLEMDHADKTRKNVSTSMLSKPPFMSRGRILKNLTIVCLGYFFLFSSYQALANLQSTLNIEGDLGVVSQSVIYASLIFSSLFLPKLVIRRLGCKITLVLCALTYAPYIAANFHPGKQTLVPTAILLGLGAAPLWSAKCTYLNEISVLYAGQTSDTADVVTSRFFGIFFMVFQNTQIWGNLVSFFVLRPSTNEIVSDMPMNFTSLVKSIHEVDNDVSLNFTSLVKSINEVDNDVPLNFTSLVKSIHEVDNDVLLNFTSLVKSINEVDNDVLLNFTSLVKSINEVDNDVPLNFTSLVKSIHNGSSEVPHAEVVCGADFCSRINENLTPPTDEKRCMLVGIYLALTALAALTMLLFLDPIQQKKEDDEESFISRVAATLKHLKKPDQILLVPITIFSGIEQAFILGDFSKAYVACAWGTYHVGLVFICFGVTNSVMSFCAGRLVKYVSRVTIAFAGVAGNMGVCLVLYLWEPSSDQSVLFFVLAGVWGLCDAIWQTQLNSFYGVMFRSQEEAAFSNYRLWESAGFALAFGYSTFLCVASKIAILAGFLTAGIIGYVAVEIRFHRAKHSSST